jgi:monoamine oxidase
VVGEFHTAYLGLAAELGLTVVPAFPGLPGEDTAVLHGSTFVGDEFGWLDEGDRRQYELAEEAFTALSREVDPDDPWSHPDARRLDETSVGDWLRSQGAGPAVIQAREMAMAALGAESVERTSLLADLRKEAAAGSPGFYDYEAWESLRVEEGSATVALRMAAELGHRVRYSTIVTRIDVAGSGCTVFAESGESFSCEAVICTLPAGPLRDVEVNGVSRERMDSLSRQRHALASKVVFAYASSFWEGNGQNGSAYCLPGYMGGTWAQREGILSALVPAERLSPLLATAPEHLQAELLEEAATMYGEQARDPQALFIRHWCTDPMTRGYITAWRPGDVMAVGPLHGTHEPPFYVAGSDQWVCGYMEGAVRTGREAAGAAIAGIANAP